jgi:hypothetical protein
MWKASLNKAIREVRFVLKPGVENHGVWHFVNKRVPELRMLNPNTFFALHEISDDMKTESAVHLVYGDVANTEAEVLTKGLSAADFEKILASKVAEGLSLDRGSEPTGNSERRLPVDVVEARQYVKHVDDTL